MAITQTTAALAAEANAFAALCNGGTIKIYTGSSPGATNAVTGTLLATLTMANPAFATTATATAALNAVAAVTAVASGTAGYARFAKSDGTSLMDVPVGASGTEILVTVNGSAGATIANGDTVSVTSFNYNRQ